MLPDTDVYLSEFIILGGPSTLKLFVFWDQIEMRLNIVSLNLRAFKYNPYTIQRLAMVQ